MAASRAGLRNPELAIYGSADGEQTHGAIVTSLERTQVEIRADRGSADRMEHHFPGLHTYQVLELVRLHRAISGAGTRGALRITLRHVQFGFCRLITHKARQVEHRELVFKHHRVCLSRLQRTLQIRHCMGRGEVLSCELPAIHLLAAATHERAHVMDLPHCHLPTVVRRRSELE